ncbi:MAG: hypothetical protein CL607_18210 [Anaerolineaceae bacterium]|nr:hypothetical protein [Anaerolineaceae bacterium]
MDNYKHANLRSMVMIPKTKKLFISYRSSDAAKVDKIARDLGLLRYDDATPRYTTWQDKYNLPPASPNWWDAIVDAIIDCDVFVFNMSKASLQSEVCQAELDYAHRRNLPVVPIVLEGEFFLDPKSWKYNITYWELVPEWLRDVQFLFYVGSEFYGRFQTAIELFENNWPRVINVPTPINPDSKSVHASNHALYDAACDYAERLAFADAEKHFSALVRRNDSDYADIAAEWLELLALYAELIEIDERRSARFIFKSKWEAYQALFPKDFLEGVFDPCGLGQGSISTNQKPAHTTPSPTIAQQPSSAPPQPIKSPAKHTNKSLMPAPFDWIEIPDKGYSIAKYPVTNTQFAVFKGDGGYHNSEWWLQSGWQEKVTNNWKSPRYWHDPKWNRITLPVIGVSWHEAFAFSRWLSRKMGERIELPTEEQWQYAAQGSDSRPYPWGTIWSSDRCNSSATSMSWGQTTVVNHYENVGDSPFGVVDMLGNVWEWCLELDKEKKPLRGGSWRSTELAIQKRTTRKPHLSFNLWGFRLVKYV